MAEKQPYIRQKVLSNIEESKKARESRNEGKGLNYDEHKFTGKNFDKLMEQRGIDKKYAEEAKTSFNKWAGKNKDPNMSQEVTAKHSPPGGDKGYVYSTKDGKQASGYYVATEKIDNIDTAKSRYATPASNQMNRREEVRVHGDQVRGTVAPQPDWTKEAKKNGDTVERKGGGTQIYTKGGYESKAVQTQKGTEFDMKQSNSKTSKVDEYGVDLNKAAKSQNTSKDHTRGR